MQIAHLEFITPSTEDWLVVVDTETGTEVYNGHGHGDEMWTVLSYLRVGHTYTEIPDEEFEEKYS